MTDAESVATTMSEPGRLVGVFFSPGAALADVARRPRWWIPWLLLSLMALAVSAAYSQRVGWEQMMEQNLARSSRGQSMSVEQRQQAIATGARIAEVSGFVAPPIAIGLSMAGIAAVLMFLVNTLLGGDLRFKSMLGIVAYSFLPGLVSSALTLLLMFLIEPQDFDLQRALMVNVGAFMPEDTAPWLVTLLGSFDLFTFWTMTLFAIGISAVAPRIRFGKALTVVLLAWVPYVAIKVLFTALFG